MPTRIAVSAGRGHGSFKMHCIPHCWPLVEPVGAHRNAYSDCRHIKQLSMKCTLTRTCFRLTSHRNGTDITAFQCFGRREKRALHLKIAS